MTIQVSKIAPLTTVKKVNSFRQLPAGWHYGVGTPPTDAIIRLAQSYLRRLIVFGFSDTDAFPGPDGEIMVTGYSGSRSVDITIGLDARFTISFQDGDSDLAYYENVPQKSALILLRGIAEKCITSGSFTGSITTRELESSRISHSRIHQTEQGFRSYTSSASINPEQASAVMSANITPESPTNRRFFWLFDQSVLPAGCSVKQSPSDSGDDCHHEIQGASNNALRKYPLQRWKIGDLSICENGRYRALTEADLLDRSA